MRAWVQIPLLTNSFCPPPLHPPLRPVPPQTTLSIGGYSSVVEHPAAIRQVLGSTPSVPFSFAPIHYLTHHNKKHGPNGDLNPGPPAPKAGIIPLDHLAATDLFMVHPEGDRRHADRGEKSKIMVWQRWDSNPRPRRDWCLKPAP